MKGIWLKVTVLLVLFTIAYWVPITSMVAIWMKEDDYSYGFLIPIISVYLIWDMRARLKGVAIKSSWSMLPVLTFLVLISLYGILGSSGYISMPSLPLLLACFTAFCFGFDLVRRLAVPLGILIFMIPIPSVIERTIGLYLKSISSKMGGAIIHFFDIPVNVSGNIIDLGVLQLQVVDACSGLRYVFPLLALGVVYAYFFERVAWKRIFCVLATIPIAILTNALRIGITGILSNEYGIRAAEGFFHNFSGWILFMAAFFFLFLLGRILALFSPRRGNAEVCASDPAIMTMGGSSGSTGAFAVSIILLVIVAGLSLSTKELPAIVLKGGIRSFPLSFGDWSGYSGYIGSESIDKSGAEDAYSGDYRNSRGDEVSLYIGYRGTAFLANENFFHSPSVCLPSAGWETLSISSRIIDNVPFWGKIEVTKMIVSQLGSRAVVYFWFQTKNRESDDKNINRFHLALHALQRDNTYDLFVRTITPLGAGRNIESSEQSMDAFVRDMMAAMEKFMEENQVRYTVPTR